MIEQHVHGRGEFALLISLSLRRGGAWRERSRRTRRKINPKESFLIEIIPVGIGVEDHRVEIIRNGRADTVDYC